VALVAVVVSPDASSAAPATKLYLSPRGSDSWRCTYRAPCRTVERAYRRARPGQTVVMRAGSYPDRSFIPYVRGRVRPAVLFRPAPRARVVLQELRVYGRHVRFVRVRIKEDLYVDCPARNVTLARAKAGLFFVSGGRGVRILDTVFGPWENGISIVAGGCGDVPPGNILLDRVFMHDYRSNPPGTKHEECLMVTSVDGLVIRRSRFLRCENFDILFKHYPSDKRIWNVTLENNWFAHPYPDGSYAVSFSAPREGGVYRNLRIRYNSFTGTLLTKGERYGVRYVNARVIGNVGTRYGPCEAGMVEAYNIWAMSPPCSRTDRRARPGFVSPTRFNLHLARGSVAIGRGHPRYFPRIDIDGQRRPRGRRPDAGADERW
jgi:hypothetical protein